MLPWSIKIGLLIFIVCLFINQFIQSGTSLFGDQSPPPITFPALVVAKPIFFFKKLL